MISFVPRSFLYFLPLHVGAEVIIGIGIFNKASGIYGILSIFTGHPISVLEWLLNLISLALLPIYVMAFLNIAKKNGLRTLLFSYLYCFDTVLSIIFTILFSIRWFSENSVSAASSITSTLADSVSTVAPSITEVIDDVESTVVSEIITSILPSSTVISETATSIISSIITPSPSPYPFEEDGYAYLAERAATDSPILNKSASLAQETSETIVITVFFLMVRIYFSLVIIGYARMLVRQQNLKSHNGQPKGSWAAKFQYLALSIAEPFWTGNPYQNTFRPSSPSDDKDDEAATHLNTDFNDDDK